MAAKEQTVESTEDRQPTLEEMAAQATRVMNDAIKSAKGLPLHVEGCGCRVIHGGEATNVIAGNVSVFFTVGEYAFRTKDKTDREALLHGEPCGINCVQLRGPKPTAVAESEPAKIKGFVPRSAWTRTGKIPSHGDLV